MVMGDKSDSSKNTKRGENKRKRKSDGSSDDDDDKPRRSLRRSCSKESPLVSDSEPQIFVSDINITHSEQQLSQGSGKGFQKISDLDFNEPVHPTVSVENKEKSSEEIENVSKLCCDSETEDQDISASDQWYDLVSFGDLAQSLTDNRNTNKLPQDQVSLGVSPQEHQISLDNLDVSKQLVNLRQRSNFKPSYVFRNLLYATDNEEVEKLSCEQEIFQPNFPMDELSEDEHILEDIRKIFESEGLLKDSIGQTETLHKHQNLIDQGNQNCDDWDKFLERWDGMQISGSTPEKSEVWHASSTSKSEIRTKSAGGSSMPVHFSGGTEKRLCIAENPDTITSLPTTSSSDGEHGSNRKCVLPSFQTEMEMIVHPVSSGISEPSPKFIKSDHSPSFIEKFISLDPVCLSDRTNGSFLSNDEVNLLVNLKGNLFKSQSEIQDEENISSGTNNSPDKIEELSAEKSPSVFDDPKTIS